MASIVHPGIVAVSIVSGIVAWLELGLDKRLLARHDSNAVIIAELSVSLILAIAYAAYRAKGEVGEVASQVGSILGESWRSLLLFSAIGFGLTLVWTRLVKGHDKATLTASELAAGLLSIVGVLAMRSRSRPPHRL